MHNELEGRFREVLPAADFCSLRYLEQDDEVIGVRQGVVQPVTTGHEAGAMITVVRRGGLGYAATSDLSTSGLRRAVEQAADWADRTASRAVTDFSRVPYPAPRGSYASPVERAFADVPLREKLDLLRETCDALQIDERIVDSSATLWVTTVRSLYLTSHGGRVEQQYAYLAPMLQAVANQGTETQSRTLFGRAACEQGGFELLGRLAFAESATGVAEEAIALLSAPNCPTGTFDLLLAPDQMILQIHECIGHPIELDRILGDERNYAGTSFVTLDMFGSYQYGSPLLNVTYDPTVYGELASFGFDDEGTAAERAFVIQDGLLLRPLGGITSQTRAGLAGVACTRAASWNRPPVDRIGNLNLEPGDATFGSLLQRVERGIYMSTNCSWSIDDSRNKFQFGCEQGRLIEDGRLTRVVKNPNYRGISATFWRSLVGVGDRETVETLGSPWCGKAEPNQVIRVGHASPACLFTGVEVFGGAG